MNRMLLVISVAAVCCQGCLPAGVFFLVAMPPLADRHEVCESCVEEAADANRLADSVPGWMEESRTLAGPTATVDRTGHFSWEVLVGGQAISRCGARGRAGWHCDPELGAPVDAPL